MCLAIVLPAKVVIEREHLLTGWQKNPDGAGFAYASKGKVVVSKGYNKLQEFLLALDKARKKNLNTPFLIHFRIRSQGDKSKENTHPFSYKHGAMIHNGTLSGTGSKYGEGKSDTCLFIEKFGDSFTKEFLDANVGALSGAVGWNKLAFLFHDGTYKIVNEQSGAWDGGVWYSNPGYKNYSNLTPHQGVMYDD